MCTRKLDGKDLEFGTTGYTMDSIFVLYDRNSDSIWYPSEDSTIDAVAGPRQGESIEILDEPSPLTLAQWLSEQPNSLVLLPTAEEAAARLRAYLGVQLEEDDGALRITGVGQETPASLAGVMMGDLIVGLNEFEIFDRTSLRKSLENFKVGDEAVLIVESGDETVELLVVFTAR